MGLATATHKAAEEAVAAQVAAAWSCELRRIAEYDRNDYYAVRGEQVLAVVEVKVRTRRRGDFPTAFLNVRKWESLYSVSQAFGVAGLFVLAFADWVGYVDVLEVSGLPLLFKGRKDRGATNDQQPVIEIPIEMFHGIGAAL